MAYTRKYKEIMRPEVRIGRNEIKPRNIYRISTYKGSKPITKTGEEARYVFVIGKVGNKIHCIKMNDIKPIDFTNLINKLRDKRKPIGNQKLNELLKTFSKEGKELYENYIKNNSKIYAPPRNNYRVYLLEKIVNVWEIRFEDNFLFELFGEKNTPNTTQEQKAIIKEETDSKEG